MRLLEHIKSLGYDVKINEGNIKLSYKGEGVPDKNRVRPLLQELKANKCEIIKMLQRSINASKTTSEGVPPTVEKLCKCGEPATTYDFGEIENGKSDWSFYCNSCNPHAINCSECSNRAILYVDSSGKHIFDKCNVHGARLKVTHADIDAWSKKKERKNHTESYNQSIRPF
jgi:hypothetical protein